MSTATESYKLLYQRHEALFAAYEAKMGALYALQLRWRLEAERILETNAQRLPGGEYRETLRTVRAETSAAAAQLQLCAEALHAVLSGEATKERDPEQE